MTEEKDLQDSIIEYLTMKRIFHWRNNTGAFKGEYKGRSRFIKFGFVGSPDIICVINGLFIGIEVKSKNGKQNDNQKEFQENLEKAGGKYLLAYSIDDIIKEL